MTRDDPIASALLSDSAYERVRYQRFGWFKQSVTRKLTLQSYLLHVLAGVLPVLALLPAELRRAYFGGPVAAAAPKVGLVALVAVGVVAAGGLGLVAVAAIRLARGDDFDEHTAHSVLNLEDLGSMVGLATGGVATVATYTFVLLGFGGVDTVRAWVDFGGGNPYAPSGVSLDVATVAVTALVLGVCLQVAAAYLHARSLDEPDVDL
ncbi:hypothetical protein [Halobaculum litoreum]|uniref:DUF2975 domain-containing protein n=1 Tax=Halobaculum litoreum TaxID=3031998 RepID=A0ABD5XPH5_9EURY|nr:hypothetical protein [Halobaculum sp. DT92]